MPLILPNDLANGTPADAAPLQQNYSSIENFINSEVIHRDGSVAMASPLLLPGAPTQPNQAATKQYVDTATVPTIWCKALHLTPGDPLTGGNGDVVLAFGNSPVSGIGTVTVNCYVGFATSNGRAHAGLYTNSYTTPASGGWMTLTHQIDTNQGLYSPLSSLSLAVPVTQGNQPSAIMRFAYTTTHLYVDIWATIQVLPGTWPS